jgi:hypothetical protein
MSSLALEKSASSKGYQTRDQMEQEASAHGRFQEAHSVEASHGEIREWVEAGKTDEWIAGTLGTSASSVQSFRSRNDTKYACIMAYYAKDDKARAAPGLKRVGEPLP